MSTMRKKPFIEKQLAKLEGSELLTLIGVMNTTAINDDYYSLIRTENSLNNYLKNKTSKIEGIKLELKDGLIRNGILIHKVIDGNKTTLFLNYHHYQDIKIYVLDLLHSGFKEIEEYLTIEELRRVVNDLNYDGQVVITPDALSEAIEGSDTVVVDLNEAGTKLKVKLDEEYVGAVQSELNATREIAEGKVKGYVIDTTDNEDFNSQNESITALSIIDINGVEIDTDDLKVGDIIYLVDLNLPDRWYAGNDTFRMLETKQVDLTSKLDATKQAVANVGGLVVPTNTPTDTALVSIETDREQSQVYLGTGLELGNNTSPYNMNVVGVADVRTGNEMKLWVGSQAQYEAIVSKDTATIYYIVEE